MFTMLYEYINTTANMCSEHYSYKVFSHLIPLNVHDILGSIYYLLEVKTG